MLISFVKKLCLGSKYLELWPEDRVLGAVFPENRVKKVMVLARRLIPPFIVFLLLYNFVLGGGLKGVSFFYTLKINWPATLCAVVLLLLLPLQGYYWAGKRAQLKLSKKLETFYRDVCVKLHKEPALNPTMFDLAVVLRQGLKTLPHDFLDRL